MRIASFEPLDGAYKAAINSGEIRLLRDRELTIDLQRFASAVVAHGTFTDYMADLYLTGPVRDVRRALGGYGAGSGEPNRFLPPDLGGTIRSLEILEALETFRIVHRNRRASIERARDAADAVIRRIEGARSR